MRVYFDTSNLIFHVECVAPRAAVISARLSQPGSQIVIRDLTRMECLVKPLRSSDAALFADFKRAFANVEVVPMTALVFDFAAQIRPDYNFKTPDPLHLSAAVLHRCDVFYAHDYRLSKYPGITVEIL